MDGVLTRAESRSERKCLVREGASQAVRMLRGAEVRNCWVELRAVDRSRRVSERLGRAVHRRAASVQPEVPAPIIAMSVWGGGVGEAYSSGRKKRRRRSGVYMTGADDGAVGARMTACGL
eukprot:GFKZ01012116.1.p2 GENE.GFKZ01012116.1~~GFKZ01012116.1.p2  ORF type:complete len:120 (-),score=13.44 GFKZ01012116.1:86-445(-)